jgi:7-keto-8-aminopelargonate synthetase-like enzyme
VIPVMVGSSLRAARLSELLFDAGINVQPMVAPSVPEGQARLRFFIASTHTEEELQTAIRALTQSLELTSRMEYASPEQRAVPA